MHRELVNHPTSSRRAQIVWAPLLIPVQLCLDHFLRAALFHLPANHASICCPNVCVVDVLMATERLFLQLFPVHLTTRSQPILFARPVTNSGTRNRQLGPDRVLHFKHCFCSWKLWLLWLANRLSRLQLVNPPWSRFQWYSRCLRPALRFFVASANFIGFSGQDRSFDPVLDSPSCVASPLVLLGLHCSRDIK